MVLSTSDSMPLIQNDSDVLVYFLFLIALVYWAKSRPWGAKVLQIFPPIIWFYFLPMISTTVGITPDSADLYDWAKKHLLPAALALLLLSADLRAIAKLGPKALVTMLAGTAGIVLGGMISLAIFGAWLPADAWQGMGALSGSWIGGSTNMVAIGASIGVRGRTVRSDDHCRRGRWIRMDARGHFPVGFPIEIGSVEQGALLAGGGTHRPCSQRRSRRQGAADRSGAGVDARHRVRGRVSVPEGGRAPSGPRRCRHCLRMDGDPGFLSRIGFVVHPGGETGPARGFSRGKLLPVPAHRHHWRQGGSSGHHRVTHLRDRGHRLDPDSRHCAFLRGKVSSGSHVPDRHQQSGQYRWRGERTDRCFGLPEESGSGRTVDGRTGKHPGGLLRFPHGPAHELGGAGARFMDNARA